MFVFGVLDFIRKLIDNEKFSYILVFYGIYSGEMYFFGVSL